MRFVLPFCIVLAFAACRDVGGVPDTAASSVASLSPALASLSRTIVIGAPTLEVARPTPGPLHGIGTFASLLGYDAFDVEVRNVTRSEIGDFLPGRIRMRAELRIRNTFHSLQLLRSSFPMAPDGVNGLMLFAAAAEAVEDDGSVVTAGNTVIVRSPSQGRVTVSTDWTGEPFDYQRSTFATCGDPRIVCARYIELPAPLMPGETSPFIGVGFDVDPTVRNVRVRLLLAANVANVQ